MTEYTPQTSASDRIEAARKALAYVEREIPNEDDLTSGELALRAALRALITPPGVGESVEQIAARVERLHGEAVSPPVLLEMAVRAGIYAAHATWEPEVAARPSQEQMLRWLGIKAVQSVEYPDRLVLHTSYIDKED